LYLTAKVDVAHRVRGLRLGAEDYMLKPFHPVELQARVDGILRRHRHKPQQYQALDVVLNLDTHTVTQMGLAVELTPQEFQLLAMLMRHKNMALSREQLLEAAWGFDYLGGTRTVDMHIQRLRKKLGWEQVIKTIFKLGYRLEVPPCG
ncbi:MAG: response regulator transcription factor, partial [Clostridiales bacterium]|nr:response regulator transcription factor [Clostridiales bacterium]